MFQAGTTIWQGQKTPFSSGGEFTMRMRLRAVTGWDWNAEALNFSFLRPPMGD